MGKKRIARKSGSGMDSGLKSRTLSRLPKKRLDTGILHIRATFNNTMAVLTDTSGNTVISASSGGLGFKGAKKGTPYAAAKVGEVLGEKAAMLGTKEVAVHVRGIGAGRESLIRAFSGKGIGVSLIRDLTPVPFNGPRPPKARRV